MDYKTGLTEACNRLAQAIMASEKTDKSTPLTKKGVTMYTIDRSRQATVKMTVNY